MVAVNGARWASGMTSGRGDRRTEQGWFRFAEVGVQFALTIVIGTLVGLWLDHRAGTSPLFTIVLMLGGFALGTFSLLRTVLGPGSRKPPGQDR